MILSYNAVISASLKNIEREKESKYHDLVEYRNTMAMFKILHEKVDHK